jgi:hypothetical protein
MDYLENVNKILGVSSLPLGGSEVPALIGAGGTLQRLEDAVEFRVWAHPVKGGDDRFLRYDSLPYAMAGYRYFKHHDKDHLYETPVAVIRDLKATNGYREVIIPKSILNKY